MTDVRYYFTVDAVNRGGITAGVGSVVLQP